MIRLGKNKVNKEVKILARTVILDSVFTLVMAEVSFLRGLLGGEQMLPWYILTSLFLISGRLADRWSSLKLDQFDDIVEINRTMPLHPKLEDYRRKNIRDAMALLPALTFPPVGIAIGVRSFAQYLRNRRLYLNQK